MPNNPEASPGRGKPFAFSEARIAAACRQARPEDADDRGRIVWRDEACTGLTLRLNVQTRSAAFYFVGKVAGRAVRRALGDVEVVTLQEAREAVNRLRFDRTVTAVLTPRPADDEADETGDPSPPVGEVADAMIAAHRAGRWLPGNRTRPPSDRTMKFYADLRRAQLKAHEALALEAFAAKLPGIYAKLQGTAPIQANRFLQLVRNVYSYAIAAGLWTGANPATGAGANRLTRTPEKPRERVLTDAEWRRMDKAMAAEPIDLWRDLFTMSIETLQRMGAVRHMRWADVTLTGADAAWKIPAQFMKGRKAGHVVPLVNLPAALEILRRRRKAVPKSCPWVFPAAEGDGGAARNYDKAWKRILERAELWSEDRDQRPRPHDLRRTGGARMTEAGVPLQTVTRALGDAPSSAGMVARVYAQVVDDALRDAFAATSKRRPRGR
ncbi:MAG: tyrosine-type recombinase/integrase [Planctomycetota bacterium]